MKVKDLIKELQKLDGELIVYGMSGDEGNTLSHIYSPEIYYADLGENVNEVPEYGLNIENTYDEESLQEMIEDGYHVDHLMEFVVI